MGNSSSKAARKLPSKAAAPWAGARTDRSVPPQLPRTALASETNNASIQRDARDPTHDPQFLEKLRQLGPVKVDHHMAPTSANSHMRHVLQSRQASEEEAASAVPPRNRLRAGELFSVLETRKVVRSREELQEIADQYNIDVDVLERMSRFVNTPSVIEETRRTVLDEEGKERFTVHAGWEEPSRQMGTSR